NTADRLRESAAALVAALAEKKIPLAVHPTGEVMLSPTTLDDWRAGRLLSVGDHRQWLLVEMPHGEFLDVLPLAPALGRGGVGHTVAQGGGTEPLLNELALTQKWIEAGCLLQVTARALAEPWEPGFELALKRWARGGFIHLLGSDGHGIDRRRPVLAAGFRRLAKWVGRSHAQQIGSVGGKAVLEGQPVRVRPPPRPEGRSWFTRLFGG